MLHRTQAMRPTMAEARFDTVAGPAQGPLISDIEVTRRVPWSAAPGQARDAVCRGGRPAQRARLPTGRAPRAGQERRGRAGPPTGGAGPTVQTGAAVRLESATDE
jgi:hypothetical protein